MPAVVRGGRRQSSAQASRSKSSRGRAARPPSGVPGKVSALGRLDLSPPALIAAAGAGVAILAAVLLAGGAVDRVGRSLHRTVDRAMIGMGFELRDVRLAGASPEARPAIARALDVQIGQPITAVDLELLRQRVEAVGWVRSARVSRLLPDTLLVQVEEHDRLAVWQLDGRNAVIDSHGQIIPGADPRRYAALPLVTGRGANEAAGAILPLLAERPRLRDRIDALVRVDERRWDLRLKGGGVIQLPALDQEAALIRLDAIDQRRRLLDLGFSRVDLRTGDELVVRPGEA